MLVLDVGLRSARRLGLSRPLSACWAALGSGTRQAIPPARRLPLDEAPIGSKLFDTLSITAIASQTYAETSEAMADVTLN